MKKTSRFEKRDKSKIKCFKCGMVGHFKSQCLQKKDLEEGNRKISSLRAKVRLSAVNQRKDINKVGQEKELLPVVDLNIMEKKVEGIRDSGAEISVLKKYLIPGKLLTGGHIYLIHVLGEKQKADLINLPLALWEENQNISSEIDVIAAVIENLNCPALITPSVYETLQKQAKLYSVGIEISNVEKLEGRKIG